MAEGPVQKKRRYTLEPDLEVVVQDEVFPVHSRDLMAASDVFATMLETNMKESEEGKIVLQGKDKEEFRVLLTHITLARGGGEPAKITGDSVNTLLKWADEYQINGLTRRCEKFLQITLAKCKKEDVMAKLDLATEYNLEGLKEAVANKMGDDIYEYRNILAKFLDNDKIMRTVLPKLCKAAGLKPPTLPPAEPIDMACLWPFVVRAIEVMRGWKSPKDIEKQRALFEKVVDAVFNSIPRVTQYRPESVTNGMSSEEIVKAHKAQFGPESVKQALNALVASQSVFRLINGKHVCFSDSASKLYTTNRVFS
eukprot:TRINITY_DN41731_c0_g1_i2.p1 TRINITY_DN41731_c0_g1~~TRINITY_DN41731_c0_g1_i2.p1  ORF type:complete len:310 (+),score=55.55 TRINITY_DN41731_c0_g1_i2:47-976(+)